MASDLIESGLVVLPGPVAANDLPRYIGAADVCVSISIADVLDEGNLRAFKTLEYIACQRPTVETVNFELPIPDWAPRVLALVPPASPMHLADGIEQALKQPESALIEGRTYVVTHRSWKAVSASTLALIDEALHQQKMVQTGAMLDRRALTG
jgi:glycosyltransferase involved in cell wall biosynthesis